MPSLSNRSPSAGNPNSAIEEVVELINLRCSTVMNNNNNEDAKEGSEVAALFR
ncbi:uncharacterized protein G2W53_007152 [Senna tora]|uniref:Uncharacterized protein n=1 Tax=Senna tora TaxID=362788 RepID=A0A834X670_9FABA|nr:uncharacterized protein G2W53_007152 [Senna tora]